MNGVWGARAVVFSALAMAVLGLTAGCAGRAEPAAPPAADAAPLAPPATAPDPTTPDKTTIMLPPIPAPPPPLPEWVGPSECAGQFRKGGIVVCRTSFNASVTVAGGRTVQADDAGLVVIGIDRDATGSLQITFNPKGPGRNETLTFPVADRAYVVQSVRGLPPSTVNPPTDPAFQARLARERDLKAQGRSSRAPIQGFLDGFIWPVEGGVQSGAWGNQRVLNGEPRAPHMGMDIAAPTGTPVRAPASGKVVLAEAGMHFDGGLVFIDHGQGVITQYLHLSRIDVKAGDRVAQGQVFGAVGATGRATGPHLCWRMRVREVEVDPGQAVVGLTAARTTFTAAGALDAGIAPRGWSP
jgi:murein DD-endopeptidase MepM/ murein hydrolase activator NlpD